MASNEGEEPLLRAVAMQNARTVLMAQQRAEEALRQSEERYRSLTQAIASVVWTTDADGRFVTPQPSWVEYTGQTWDEYRDFGWVNALHSDDRKRVRALWNAARDDQTLFHLDGRLWHVASGAYRHFEARGVPILNASGILREWIGTFLDVEDRTVAETALRQLAADLSDADHRKNEFLAVLAHELRNPLAPIRSGLDVLRQSDRNSEAFVTTSAMMERQLAHIVRLVEDLLDVSRISRGKIELRRERIDLASAVKHAVEASRELVDCMHHELTVVLPSRPIYLHADHTRLAQVMGNLVNNACKFADAGGRIVLSVAQEGPQAVISVRDSGVGIAADHIPRIFEMFAQVESTIDRSASGLGIGLTLVKTLVELHGGTVEVRSDGIGHGSEFVVQLPIMADVQSVAPPTAHDAPSPAVVARRILVVDDNVDAATSLAMLLTLSGHVTHLAHDGVDAVGQSALFKPDLVLMDIGLPQLNGYEAARQIREQPGGEHIGLVALTGWGQEQDRQKSRDAGFNAHMVKPVALDALLALIASLPAAYN